MMFAARGRRAICPPAGGASLARWQALTVPARVLVTVSATLPRPTSTTSTVMGFARPSHITVATPATARPARIPSVRHFIPRLLHRPPVDCSTRPVDTQFGTIAPGGEAGRDFAPPTVLDYGA